ncbi:MAG: hypothetical protein H6553_08035 [Chitinophagales bacterium]|nr:hypothetical protein [Chitinophagales bacterium]
MKLSITKPREYNPLATIAQSKMPIKTKIQLDIRRDNGFATNKPKSPEIAISILK